VARPTVIQWVDSASLGQIMRENEDLVTSALHIDSLAAYGPVGRKIAGRQTVIHFAGEYAGEKSRGTQI